jgi:hypothetical protein
MTDTLFPPLKRSSGAGCLSALSDEISALLRTMFDVGLFVPVELDTHFIAFTPPDAALWR